MKYEPLYDGLQKPFDNGPADSTAYGLDGAVCTTRKCEFMASYNPIETPAEKAQRLREEWCIKALSSCSILSGMQRYELKRLGGYIEDIYDALLSGELSMPSNDGE